MKVFSLSSVLLWIALIFGFVDYKSSIWYPFYGSWVEYMVTEAMLLGLSIHARQSIPYYRALTGIQILRLCLLFLLLCSSLPSGFDNRKAREVDTDEENAPLLAPGNCQDLSTGGDYSTMNGTEDETGSFLQDGGKKEELKKESDVLQDFMVSACERL